jgi:hypothetical protein
MLCPHCASQIADNVRACPRCGMSLAIDSPVLASTDVARDIPQQERRIRQILISVVLLAVAGWIAWRFYGHYERPLRTTLQTIERTHIEAIPVVSGTMTLKPRTPSAVGFVVPPGCKTAVLESRFDESAAQGLPAQMIVFDEAAYAAWKSRQASHAAYTGKVRAGTLEVTLPPTQARYFLVFTNTSSALPKTLHGQVQLDCSRTEP